MMPHTPLDQYRGMYAGHTIYVVGSGPFLWNWPPKEFLLHPTIFCNSSIHYMRLQPEHKPHNIFRILMDAPAVDDYFTRPFYRSLADHSMPNVHTFVSFHMLSAMTAEQKAKVNALDFTCYYLTEDQVVPFEKMPSGYLWKPTVLSAISLAVHMGAAEIRLAAVDYGANDNLAYWDGNYKKDEAAEVNDAGKRAQKVMRHAELMVRAAGVKLRQFVSPRKEIPVGVKATEA